MAMKKVSIEDINLKEPQKNPQQAKRFKFELSLGGVFALGLIAVLGVTWAFILGILVGRGYRPEKTVPRLETIMPTPDPGNATAQQEPLKPEDLQFYETLQKRPDGSQPAPPPRLKITDGKPAAETMKVAQANDIPAPKAAPDTAVPKTPADNKPKSKAEAKKEAQKTAADKKAEAKKDAQKAAADKKAKAKEEAQKKAKEKAEAQKSQKAKQAEAKKAKQAEAKAEAKAKAEAEKKAKAEKKSAKAEPGKNADIDKNDPLRDGVYNYIYQVASLENQAQAQEMQQRLRQAGLYASVEKAESGGKTYYRVNVPFRGRPIDTRELKDKLASVGVKKALLRSKKPI